MAPVKHKKRRARPRSPRLAQGTSTQVSANAARDVSANAPRSAKLTVSPAVAASFPPNSTSPSTDLADQLHSVAIHLLRRLRVRDRESGIGPAQLSALSVLVFGGPRSHGELADAEQVRPPTMSRIVAGLERTGLVRRETTEDGRRVRLEATPLGVTLMWEGRQRRVASLASALEALPENERELLRMAVASLQKALRNL